MTNEEAIKTIEIAIAEVEWNYPMDYAIAFENAISVAKMYLNIECLITNDRDIVNIHRV